MKTKRKALLLSLCAVLLVVASVMGTMAYLTSTTGTVTNTFTVGEAVVITLDEAKTDANGVAVTPASRITTGNQYKLMPGHEYTKDPTVHVTGETCYVFVKVSNGISDIEAAGNTTIAAQMAAKGWKAVEGKTGLYVYANGDDTKTAVSKSTDLTVFEKFVVNSTLDRDALADVASNTITITAYAVQVDGFENNTPAEIWTATFNL